MLAATQMHQCYVCHGTFDPPEITDPLLTLPCCSKLFHKACATDWASKNSTCMNCTRPVNLSEEGKELSTLWERFQRATKEHPESISELLVQEELFTSPDTDCPSCREDYPQLPINYLPEVHRFAHTTCPTEEVVRPLHLAHLSILTKQLGGPISECAGCAHPFTLEESPILEGPMLVTTCFHIFHKSCLAGWVKTSSGTCPNCREICYQHQAGKDLTVVWKMFLNTLSKCPDIALEMLSKEPSPNGQCTTCCIDHPLTPLFFDPVRKQLFHTNCSRPSTAYQLTLDQVVSVVKICAEKIPPVQKLFTSDPPSPYQIAKRDGKNFLKSWVPVRFLSFETGS